MSGRTADRNRSTQMTGPWDRADTMPSAGVGGAFFKAVVGALAATAGGKHSRNDRYLPTRASATDPVPSLGGVRCGRWKRWKVTARLQKPPGNVRAGRVRHPLSSCPNINHAYETAKRVSTGATTERSAAGRRTLALLQARDLGHVRQDAGGVFDAALHRAHCIGHGFAVLLGNESRVTSLAEVSLILLQ